MSKAIYKKALSIGLPVAFENMIYSLINFIDIFMVGKDIPLLGLGTIAVASLGFANQIFQIFVVSLFGAYSGAGIFAAQYFGNKEYINLKRCLGLMITIGLLFSSIFLLFGLTIPEKVIGVFTNDKKALLISIKYFKIALWTFPLVAISFAVSMQLRAIGRPKYSFYSSFIGLVVNVILNTILIFGKLGFPALGVEGAAIATLIARIVSLLYLIYIIYKFKLPIVGSFYELFGYNFIFVKKVLRISLPVIFHEFTWILGISMYVVMYGKIGTNSVAAIQIVHSISGLVITLLFGLSNASASIIGNEIGSGNEEKAYETAVALLKGSLVVGIVIALFMYFVSPVLLVLMNVSNDIHGIVSNLMLIEGIILFGKSISTVLIVGILRAGGDTLWTMYVDLIPLWFVSLPLTYFLGIILKLPIELVFLISITDDGLKILPCILRMKSKKWINNLIK